MHTFQRSTAVSGQRVALSSLDTSLQCITGFSALGQSSSLGQIMHSPSARALSRPRLEFPSIARVGGEPFCPTDQNGFIVLHLITEQHGDQTLRIDHETDLLLSLERESGASASK